MSRPSSDRLRLALLDALVLLAIAGLALWLRWPALGTEGFHNEDAAGITYNADQLRLGFLPMVDNLEVKAPGAFYLSWMVWGALGRSLVALQRFMCCWSILASAGIYVGGRLLYGRASGVVAALVYTLFAPITDSIDINYGAWMITPYVWSTVLFVAGLRGGRSGWYAGSGFLLAIAGVFKRQAAVLFPLFLAVLLLGRLLDRPGAWPAGRRRRDTLAFLAGLAAGFAPILIYYLAHGALWTFVEQYFLNRSGWRYVQGELDWGEKLGRVGDGFLGFWAFMAVPSLLALMSLGALRGQRGFGVRGTLLGGHFWMSFAGAALGFRFFKGYYLQCLPAAAWLAAHPAGPLVGWWRQADWPRGAWRRLGRVALLGCVLLALVPAAIGDVGQLGKIRKQRRRGRDLEAQKVARIIRENTDPWDRIWVWGRWGWPIYFHADRVAASRIYKTLGIVTNNLTNTWRRSTQKTRFVPVGPYKELVADLEHYRPKFIAVARNEGYRDFKGFKRLLRAQYRSVTGARLRQFTLYRRKDVSWRKAPRRSPRHRSRRRSHRRSRRAR